VFAVPRGRIEEAGRMRSGPISGPLNMQAIAGHHCRCCQASGTWTRLYERSDCPDDPTMVGGTSQFLARSTIDNDENIDRTSSRAR